MASAITDLERISDELSAALAKAKDTQHLRTLQIVEDAVETIGNSWSGSWIGYQANVYYADFNPPIPGDHFSAEWGLMRAHSHETGWQEFSPDVVRAAIFARAGNPDLTAANTFAKWAQELFEETHSELISILDATAKDTKDAFLTRLSEQVQSLKTFSARQFIRSGAPQQLMSRDSTAMSQGMWTPPHLQVLAEAFALRQPIAACDKLARHVRQAVAHVRRLERRAGQRAVGTNVFIGHGRSHLWRSLKDFVQDRLSLPWDEFNRIPVAGITNIARLSEMLESAAVALLVMTAEDEQVDGTARARENVVHEAGLFQGRLGFTRAIVLLEEACGEFSNIQGLGQIRFPSGCIEASFEDVRRVLEREGLLEENEGA